MSEELFTGVEMQDDPAAGDQQEEEDIFGLDDTGEEETQEDAASEEAETGAFEDESKEKAFAARLRKEREKIAQETEERLRQEYEAKYQHIQQQQRYIPPPQAPPPLPRQQLEELADQLGVTIETANAM